jgi:protein-disulfide isomerase
MKPSHLAIAAVAILATAACNSEKTDDNAATSTTTTGEAVPPPASGDWSEVVTATDAGGFMMGNPRAKVKLIEFASLTCPHCAEFEEKGLDPLTEKYVKTGQVAFEFRNFVRDPFDLTASLITRCGGAKSFFPLTKAMFADQANWVEKIQGATPEQQQALSTMPPQQQFKAIAGVAGFQQWAAMRGIPTAKSDACLIDQKTVDQLVQMNNDAVSQFNIPGTPTFVINGKVVENAATWEALEPNLKAAL